MTCDEEYCTELFPCENCTVKWLEETGRWEEESKKAIWKGVTKYADPVSPNTFAGNGSGDYDGEKRAGGNTAVKGGRPASEKQLAYLQSLMKKLGQEMPEGLSSAEASDMIGLAKTEVDDLQKSEPAEEFARWKKSSNGWALYVVGKNQGDTVTVRKASGEENEIVLGEKIADNFYKPGQQAVTKSNIEIVSGKIYLTKSGTVVKACESQAGRMYGKEWCEETRKFEYAPSALRDIERALTLEEAKEFGQKTGVCCCCARELTNPESIAAGIGPICATKYF